MAGTLSQDHYKEAWCLFEPADWNTYICICLSIIYFCILYMFIYSYTENLY